MAAEETRIYDMLRNKAKDMGHPAGELSDEAWEKYAKMSYKRSVLNDSKLIITDYIMGRLSPVDLAEAMANDDKLRYTISDVCRMRLEPADIDIQHNGKYIDIGAGVKTFWSEMKVPIPSEVEAARDLRNIYFGIEAARATMDVEKEAPEEISEESEDESKEEPKKSFRDRIREAKQKAAQKGIDILTPMAENPEDESETESKQEEQESNQFEELLAMGLTPEQAMQAYQGILTNKCAMEIENIAMTVEASKDPDLEESERVKALKAAGVSEDAAEEMVQDTPKKGPELRTDYTEEELNQPMNDQIAEILDQIQEHASRDNQKGFHKGPEESPAQAPRKDIHSQYRSDNKPESSKGDSKRLRKNYVKGEFEGKEVRFKGSWSNHTFSEDEVIKLLAGESISFMYTNSSGEEKEVSGKLEYQSYEGRDFLGFKANFNKQQKTVEAPALEHNDDSLFDAQAEALMMEEEASVSLDEANKLFDDSENLTLTDADVAEIPNGEDMPFAK